MSKLNTQNRKQFRLSAMILSIVLFLLLLSSCGNKLSGSYESTGTVFTFEGNNFTMSAFGVNATGTYELKENTIKVSYLLFGIDCGIDFHSEWSFRQDGDKIFIQGEEFKKVK